MAYFNDTNGTSFYPTSSAYEFDAYPSQTSASEQANDQNFDAFANGWSVGSQPDYLVGSLTGFGTEESFEPVSSVQDHGYDLSSYPEHYWPATGQHAQSHPSSIMGWDNSFVSTVASEVSTATSAPTDIPLNYWGDSESGPSASTFYADVQTLYQPSTGMIQTRRYQPYEMPRARLNEYANAEAGPSNLAPPLVSYAAPPTTYPSGGSSEATADAEEQTVTEEDVAPTTKRPRGSGPPRNGRTQYQRDTRRLCAWAKRWKGLAKPPTHREALGTALGAVELIRVPVYDAPRLKKGVSTRTTQGKKAPDAEHRRRMGTREINEELSRYYQLGVNQSVWRCPELLRKVLDEVENLPEPPAVPSA